MLLSVDEYVRQAKMCMRCTFCKFIDLNWVTSQRFSRQCPIDTKYAFNLFSPHGLLHSALTELDGKLEFTPKLMEALYQCTLCHSRSEQSRPDPHIYRHHVCSDVGHWLSGN